MKRASYREAVQWIGENDEPGCRDVEQVSGFVSTLLVADLFRVEADKVAADVVRYREKSHVAPLTTPFGG